MEKVIYDFYSDLFDSHVHLPPCHLREDGYVIPSVLPSEVRHAIKSVKNHTAPGPDRIRPEHLKSLPTATVNTLARLFTRYLSECKALKSCQDESDSDLADEIDLRNPEVIQLVRLAR
ncbi:hypothetical protein ANCCEY_03824 [Ancylostoma ceylanicum]|uniref:Uncharacterized protein n=1 Tax=Ancylostoma ceylanicum TaxID=53326 RepID=A0A0D6M0Y0_9BILA|nr:hypothetical protein ANCCEY_03824 [Ancylostoma ceylanicum]